MPLPHGKGPGTGVRYSGWQTGDAAHEASDSSGEEYNNGRFCPSSVTPAIHPDT